MEIPPLFFSALGIMKQLRERGIRVETVMAPMDDRFFVYMMGRGVPPPSNTFRWCTPKIKVEPMMDRLQEMHKQTGKKFLLLTGVRQGESAKRDGRIAMSCGKDGAECGQGWYQVSASDDICDKLAPLLHWRVCSVWDWLSLFAPMERHGAWETALLADVYGGEEAEEINARTGCIGCPLASKDKGLMVVTKKPEYQYLAPLMELKSLYRELKKPVWRKRKTEWQYRSDGTLSKNQNRMGPLTMKARRMALRTILSIQRSVNTQAKAENKSKVDILNIHEVIRINELIAKNTWPKGWTGEEENADLPFVQRYNNGNIQSDLFIKPNDLSI